MGESSLAILIPAHDSYQDVLKLFCEQKNKFWNKCPYNIYWSNCEQKIIKDSDIQIINNGMDASFSKRIKNALEKIDSKYILLILEDFIISDIVDNERISEIIKIMDVNKYNYCGITSKISKRQITKTNYVDIYEIDSNKPYGLSINVGIFKKDYLYDLIIDDNFSGWQLEDYFLELAKENKNEHCICDVSNPLCVVHLIDKGKIIPSAKKELEQKNIKLSINRPSLPVSYVIKKYITGVFSSVVPMSSRVYIKKGLSKLGFKFVTKY